MVTLSERFEMRLDEQTLARVDQWRSDQPDVPSRAEAMRRLVEQGLARTSTESLRLSDGDKLLLVMMRDVYKALKIKDPGIDPEFISEVIWGGHYWAAQWKFSGIFHGHEDNPATLRYVQNVLDMWNRLERGFERLPKAEKAQVQKEADRKDVKFYGFDGNNESEELGIASFLTEKMDRWSRFKGRDLNSHMPTRAIYGRMLDAFEPMRRIEQDDLSVEQITNLLKAMPSRK
jgi:uncharacterized protein